VFSVLILADGSHILNDFCLTRRYYQDIGQNGFSGIGSARLLVKLFLRDRGTERQLIPEQYILREDKIRRASVFPECASELFAQEPDPTRAATRIKRRSAKFRWAYF
jgi:hypothetical protein